MTPAGAGVVVTPEVVEQNALTLVDKAKLIKVVDQKSYEQACEMVKTVKALRKEVEDVFGPIVTTAHLAHRTACAQRAKVDDPLKAADTLLRGELTTYERAREAERQEAQRIAQAEADRVARIEAERIAEEQKLQAAIEAEANGDKAGMEEILAAPTAIVPHYTAPVSVAPTYNKVAGVSSRENWQAEVTDLMALVKAVAVGRVPLLAVCADEAFLRKQAKAMKSLLNYDGVQVRDIGSTVVR